MKADGVGHGDSAGTGGADPLAFEIVHAAEGSLFGVNSTILYGATEAVIVDAQFERANADAVVARAQELGRRVTTIYISHNDPDFYFGADRLRQAFPEAAIVSTPQTAQVIERNHAAKLEFWGPQLGEQAPAEIIVPEPLDGDRLTVDGYELRIVGFDDGVDPDHTFLWVETLRAVVGGISLFADSHLWLADNPQRFSRDVWRARLAAMKALEPRIAIPAHSAPEVSTDTSIIDFMIGYLQRFDAALDRAATTAELVETMRSEYPGLAGEANLEMSARVLRGEQPWVVTAAYPATGRTATVDFGEVAYELEFGLTTMTFRGVKGAVLGATGTQDYRYDHIGPEVFTVYWQEPASGARVVHIHDFQSRTVSAHIADGASPTFLHLAGTLSLRG